jgi:hypothetical protein
MVGMPYPNVKSPELQEKMAYLDQTLVSTSSVPQDERRGLERKSCVTPGLGCRALCYEFPLHTFPIHFGGFSIYLLASLTAGMGHAAF